MRKQVFIGFSLLLSMSILASTVQAEMNDSERGGVSNTEEGISIVAPDEYRTEILEKNTPSLSAHHELASVTLNSTNYITSNNDATQKYASLKEAIEAATDNDILTIHGEINLDEDLTINKSITLKGNNSKIKSSTTNDNRIHHLLVNAGNTLTLGSANDNELLTLDEVHVEVTKGKLIFQAGALIRSKLMHTGSVGIVNIKGKESSATFTGGQIINPIVDYNDYGVDNNNTAVIVADGAKVEKISGGTYKSWGTAWKVTGEDTTINTISGGEFQNAQNSGLSNPCFLLEKKAKILTISGGTFKAYHFGALQLESEASVETISGGTFTNDFTTTKKPFQGSNGEPYCSGLVLYGRNGKGATKVSTISGGTFTGVNGLLAVGSDPEQKIVIDKITGGRFNSLNTNDGDTALYFSQNVEVNELSGEIVASGKNNGIWNAGTIKEIKGGSYTGTEKFGISNVDLSQAKDKNGKNLSWAANFKGKVEKISGGTFKGKNSGLSNLGEVSSISNGNFQGEYAICCSEKTGFGSLTAITGGNFYAEKENSIHIVKELKLEENLNQPVGLGRYHAPKGKDIFNDATKVTFPTYNLDGVTTNYFMSLPDDVKTVKSYPNVGFRYLRQKASPEPKTEHTEFKAEIEYVPSSNELAIPLKPGRVAKTGEVADKAFMFIFSLTACALALREKANNDFL